VLDGDTRGSSGYIGLQHHKDNRMDGRNGWGASVGLEATAINTVPSKTEDSLAKRIDFARGALALMSCLFGLRRPRPGRRRHIGHDHDPTKVALARR
jgi:hypothetical protein